MLIVASKLERLQRFAGTNSFALNSGNFNLISTTTITFTSTLSTNNVPTTTGDGIHCYYINEGSKKI